MHKIKIISKKKELTLVLHNPFFFSTQWEFPVNYVVHQHGLQLGPKKISHKKEFLVVQIPWTIFLLLSDLVLATQHYYPHHRGLITGHKTTSTTNPKVLGLTFT